MASSQYSFRRAQLLWALVALAWAFILFSRFVLRRSVSPEANPPAAPAFTLSHDALLSLAPGDDSLSIEGKRDLSGSGVQLDLRWNRDGRGELVLPNDTVAKLRGLTPDQFSKFAITCELISMDGAPPTARLGDILCSALVNGYGSGIVLSPGRVMEMTTSTSLRGPVEWLSLVIRPMRSRTKEPAPSTATIVLKPAADAEALPNARIAALPRSAPSVPAGALTLEDAALLALDCHGQTRDASGIEVRGTRDVEGSGVEFDVHFPADRDPAKPLRWVSSFDCGKHRLVSSETGEFTNVALDMGVVKVNGEPPTAAVALRASPSLNGNPHFDGAHDQPLWAGFPGRPDVQTMIISDPAIYDRRAARTVSEVNEIGFRLYLHDSSWTERDVTLTLRVAATPSATPLRLPKGPPPTFTLSDEALMRLEAQGGSTPIRARRDVHGPGVEFDFETGPRGLIGEYNLPFDILTRIRSEEGKIGGSFALELTLVDSVPKFEGDDGVSALVTAGSGMDALDTVIRGGARRMVLMPARGPGLSRIVVRDPADGLGILLNPKNTMKPDGIERIVTILIKPAPEATALP